MNKHRSHKSHKHKERRRSREREKVDKTETWDKYAKVYEPLKVGSIDGTDIIPHDKGIVRAINSTYLPDRNVKGDPSHTIFVARLNPKTTEDTLTKKFSDFGKIVSCRLVKDIVTGKSKRYCFIEYNSSRSAYKAYKKMNKEYIDNSEILVDFELERTMSEWKPRRLGGGFGGKRDAGQLRFGCRDRPFLQPVTINKPYHHSDSKYVERNKMSKY